jgi:alpha-D-xyloside xylohydrolase
MHGDSPREPWIFGEEALAIVRRYVELRYQLFPYLYSAAIEAHGTAMPVMRALALMWPEDPHALHCDQQYMLGPSMMVAPVVHPSGRKTVYLPEGDWIDYWTRECIRGPVSFQLQVPPEILPLYVRGSAVIPMLEPGAKIETGSFTKLVLDLHPEGPSSTVFADDDGETKVIVTPGLDNVCVRWEAPVERTYRMRVHVRGKGGTAVLEGETGRSRKGSLLIRT